MLVSNFDLLSTRIIFLTIKHTPVTIPMWIIIHRIHNFFPQSMRIILRIPQIVVLGFDKF